MKNEPKGESEMKSQLFEQDKMEKEGVAGRFLLQNRHTLKVELNGEVYAKQGAMAAYQGNVEFSFHGGGVRRMLKKMISGENLQLMKVSGRGEIFFSDFGAEVQIVQLENDSLTINTSNLLAFESTLQWDIKMVKPGMQMLAAGLSNVTVSGTGQVAISSFGTPFVLQVNEPTYVDVQAALAWSSSLQTDIKSTFKVGSLIGRGSGESFQMLFTGDGFVVVQPSEAPRLPTRG
jgi:uncharacterized protein (AIM24 family)